MGMGDNSVMLPNATYDVSMGWFDRKIIATGYRSLEYAHKNTMGMGDNSVMLPMMCLWAGLIGKL